ncbi:MAG TPA: MurT ligase domain-containing protein [Solirubrobacterales bacterium]|jgi:UDP-N-acetylmuramyl tripeptide synthase|nr:MurT ligase domain-containing protein [Solirubrobacterales bacterium]
MADNGRAKGSFFGAKLALSRAVGAASRASGRGGGTTLPGRLLLRLEPEAIGRLGTALDRGTTIVSATNGKTTTAGMIASILAADGRRPVHNRAGSNMTWGVATALLEQKGEEGLFEVDEAWLPRVTEQLHPSLIVLGNLFRDQLDRYGEMEALADDWAKTVAARAGLTNFVLNADDPLIADLGRNPEGDRRQGVLYFGIEDNSQALPELQHAFDAKHCRRCGHPYAYERAFVGHLGHYSCPNCGAERPQPEVAATAIELHGMDGSRVTVRTPQGELELELPLPGLYNVYNALAAVAAGLRLGVAPERIARALGEMRAAFGRVETIAVGGVPVSILLIKNPAGANEVLRTLMLESRQQSDNDEGIDLWIALNDRIADGRDVSWIWDADFELLAGGVRRVVCAGTRAPEMALRLKYAGWPEEAIEVVPGIDASLDAAVAGSQGRLFALPTYTALMELRKLLADRGLAKEFWR